MFKRNPKNYKYIPKYLFTWLFSGKWEYGFNPSLFKRIRKYYRESWQQNGYGLLNFIRPNIKTWISIK